MARGESGRLHLVPPRCSFWDGIGGFEGPVGRVGIRTRGGVSLWPDAEHFVQLGRDDTLKACEPERTDRKFTPLRKRVGDAALQPRARPAVSRPMTGDRSSNSARTSVMRVVGTLLTLDGVNDGEGLQDLGVAQRRFSTWDPLAQLPPPHRGRAHSTQFRYLGQRKACIHPSKASRPRGRYRSNLHKAQGVCTDHGPTVTRTSPTTVIGQIMLRNQLRQARTNQER